MKTVSFGTQEFVLEGVRKSHPLVITIEDKQKFIIECPFFKEYGVGNSFEEAKADLVSSLKDLKSALGKHRRRLSDDDRRILKRLEDEIQV